MELGKKLEEVMNKVVQIIECRPPDRTNTFFLKDKFLSFQFNRFLSDNPITISSIASFLHNFANANPKEQDQICEYYLHNYVM